MLTTLNDPFMSDMLMLDSASTLARPHIHSLIGIVRTVIVWFIGLYVLVMTDVTLITNL